MNATEKEHTEHVGVSRRQGRGEEGLTISMGAAHIDIDELRIRPMSNWATPHELLGKGGARFALTDKQMLWVIAEYVRYRLQDPVEHSQTQVGFAFACCKQSTDK